MQDSAYDIFERAIAHRIDYFRYWTHDVPMVVSSQRDEELHRVQRVLATCAHYYGAHYRDYLDRIPYDERTLQALALVEGTEYKLGTFRPDYVIREDGAIKLCEITSRFFGNGYFYSFFMDHTGRELAREAGVTEYTSRIEAMLDYFADMARGKSELIVLESADRSDSIPLYTPFYRDMGLKIRRIEPHDIARDFQPTQRSLVVSALNQVDLLSQPDDVLRRYVQAETRNDLRTVLLLHDKRFFSLFHDDEFCGACLGEEDTAFLRDHVVPTYTRGEHPEIWEEARREKDGYMLKHCRLGKSEKVFAGCLTSQDDWEAQFSGTMDDMILQPFIRQRAYAATWKGDDVVEYICGTILCLDDEFFGTGNYRASTLPVVNTGNDSKVAPLVTDRLEAFPGGYVL